MSGSIPDQIWEPYIIVKHIWPQLTFDLYEGIIIISDLTKVGSHRLRTEHSLLIWPVLTFDPLEGHPPPKLASVLWPCLAATEHICDAINQNDSEVEKYDFWFFGISYHFFGFNLVKTPQRLGNWFQRYKQLKDWINNTKQKTLLVLFDCILKTVFVSSDSFCLITSHTMVDLCWPLTTMQVIVILSLHQQLFWPSLEAIKHCLLYLTSADLWPPWRSLSF